MKNPGTCTHHHKPSVAATLEEVCRDDVYGGAGPISCTLSPSDVRQQLFNQGLREQRGQVAARKLDIADSQKKCSERRFEGNEGNDDMLHGYAVKIGS